MIRHLLHRPIQKGLNRLLAVPQPHSMRVAILRAAGAKIGSGVAIHGGVEVLRPAALSIGSGTTVNRGALLDARGGLDIGDGVMIGAWSKILTAGHSLVSHQFDTVLRYTTIGSGAVIFPAAVILPGCSLGADTVVLTCSVVTRPASEGVVIGGNPAIEIKERGISGFRMPPNRVWFASI